MEINLEFIESKSHLLNGNEKIEEVNGDEVNGSNENLNDAEISAFNEVHYVPCSIEYDGPAQVNKYFETYLSKSTDEKDSKRSYEGSFRGYPLKGKEVVAPEGHSFILMKESKSREAKTLKESKRFSNFVCWNVSNEPCTRDPLFQALMWIDVAKLVHE